MPKVPHEEISNSKPMHYNKEIFSGLVDFVRINAPALGSSGLYQGKAGVALSLFAASGVLKDEEIENEALELLQQSLLVKTDQIDTPSGLAGIGFVLTSLISNGLLEADFDELYSVHCSKITAGAELLLKKEEAKIQYFDICFFLMNYNSFHSSNISEALLTRASEIMENSLDTLSQNSVYKNNLAEELALFLKIALYCNMPEYAVSSAMKYSSLYSEGRMAASWSAGHYLEQIAKATGNKDLSEAGKSNRDNSFVWFELEHTLSLRSVVNTLEAMLSYKEYKSAAMAWIDKKIMQSTKKNLEKWLMTTAPSGVAKVGYGYGIARLVLLLCKLSGEAGKEKVSNKFFI